MKLFHFLLSLASLALYKKIGLMMLIALLAGTGSALAETDDRDLHNRMKECKLEIENLRIKKNRIKLLAEGVSLANIECYAHTLDEVTEELEQPNTSTPGNK